MNSKLPSWFKQEIPGKIVFERSQILSDAGVHTVCVEAKCPNINTCFKSGKFTFLILGDTCTRNCRFCAVAKAEGASLSVDLKEPLCIAEAVKKLSLDYVVITSVTRDDLADGGAGVFARSIELIHEINKNIKVEVLIPDFRADENSLKCVLDASPDIAGHNIETVRRLYKDLRPLADYEVSLAVLRKIKELKPGSITKSALMLGLGERDEEVVDTIKDLRDNYCDILVLGQYLAPSPRYYPIKEFIAPEQFQKYQKIGIDMGFKVVLSAPKARSSYQAQKVYQEFYYA